MTTMEFNGVPLHPLVVHAAVVFGPLASLAALGYVGLPRWRDRLRLPMVVVALMAGGAIVAAYLTGKSFFASRPAAIQALPLLHTHQTHARQLLWVSIGFAIVAVVAFWLHTRTGAVRTVLNVVLGAFALGVLVLCVLTGDAGARAVWG
jgi:cell division protein FtsW (lipid II flippase)